MTMYNPLQKRTKNRNTFGYRPKTRIDPTGIDQNASIPSPNAPVAPTNTTITSPVDYKPYSSDTKGLGDKFSQPPATDIGTGTPITTPGTKGQTTPVNTGFTGTAITVPGNTAPATTVVPKSFSPQDLYSSVADMMAQAPGTDLNTAYQHVLAGLKAKGGVSSWPEAGLWEYISKEWARTHPQTPVQPETPVQSQTPSPEDIARAWTGWQQQNIPRDEQGYGLNWQQFAQKYGGQKPFWISDGTWGRVQRYMGMNDASKNRNRNLWASIQTAIQNEYRQSAPAYHLFLQGQGPNPDPNDQPHVPPPGWRLLHDQGPVGSSA